MSTVQAISKSHNINFKGEVKKTPNGNSYYATDMGGKFMGGFAIADTVINVLSSNQKAVTLVGGAIGTGICYGMGHYVDKKRNQKAALATDYIQKVGAEKALETSDRIDIAENGHLYYKSNDGRKYLTRIGATIGGAIGLCGAFFGSIILKNIPKAPKLPLLGALITFPVIGAGLFALGGWIDGAIVDWLNNRSARKHA